METTDNHIIDDLYRSRFSNFEADPPAHVFDKIKSSVGTKHDYTKTGSFIRNYRIAFIGASVLLISTLVFLYVKLPQDSSTKQSHKNIQPVSKSDNSDVLNAADKIDISVTPENKHDKAGKTVVAPGQNSNLTVSAGDNATVCGLNYTMNAALPGKNCSGSWTGSETDIRYHSGKYSNPSSDPEAEVSVPGPGKYKFIWRVTDGNQTASDEVEINFVKLPVADAGKDATVCGNDIDLKAKGTKGYWNLIDGVNYTDRNSTATHARFTGSGLLNFVWTEITDKCLSRDTVNITFIPNPIAEIKPGEAQKCFGSPVTLIRPENPGCRYDWDLDGGKVTSSSDNKVTVYWKYGAEHTVTLTASNERNCKSVSRFTVKQPVPPEASFTHSALDESAPVLVYFINRSATGNDTGKPGYLWKFGDKQTSNEDNPEHLYVHNGNYKITLIVTDSKGCSDSASTVLNISGNNKSRMKIFSPNGDGVNDIFRTGPTDLSNFKCVILNGNGEKIFEWNNPGDGWDGTLNHHGNPASEGLYYFVITGTDESGKSVELGGTVYLLRN